MDGLGREGQNYQRSGLKWPERASGQTQGLKQTEKLERQWRV